jgi:hypothetical protein
LLNNFLGDARHEWSGIHNIRAVGILASLIFGGAERRRQLMGDGRRS